MQDAGRMFLGDMINCFRTGSLVRPLGDTTIATNGSLLFGTVSGSVGKSKICHFYLILHQDYVY